MDIRLPGFLQNDLTSGEARNLRLQTVREGSFEPVRDSSADTIFHG